MANLTGGVWGIDLGQCALKALRLETIDGQVTATAFDYVEHPKILSQPDADADQLTREALEKFLSRNSLAGDLVAISVPGQSGLARFVKLPPVEEKKIPEIVKFEAKQQIPFNLDEVVWDFQKIGSGMVTDGFALETEVGLFAIKRDTVNRCLNQFRDVNIEVHLVQMAPLALCNYVAYDLLEKGDDDEESAGRKRCVVALDIGADNSNLVITDGGKIIWQRPIPLGGNHFTRALTKELKLTFAKAEHLKRNATKSPELKQILAALKPVLNDFVGEVQRSLSFFTNTHRDAHILYMMGLGNAFRLPGLQKYLGEKLSLDVRKLGKLERLTGDEVVAAPQFAENVLSFAAAYGLALQGLGAARLRTNLLPQEIRMERMIRAKKPYAAAAAAALLFGTSASLLGYALQYRAVAGEAVEAAMKSGEETVKKAGDLKTRYQGTLDQIETDKKEVRSIVAGQEERMNWLALNQYLNDVLPKPDGSNLSLAQRPLGNGLSIKDYYFDQNSKAQEAYQSYLARSGGTEKPRDPKDKKTISDEEEMEDLVHVNIEAVNTLYTENLQGVVSTLKALDPIIAETMRDRNAVLTEKFKKGWVVELRGYTFNRHNRQFIVDTLVENLGRMRRVAKGAGGTPGAIPGIPGVPGATPGVPGAVPGTPVAAATPAAPGAEAPMGAGTETPMLNENGEPVEDLPEEEDEKEFKDPLLNRVTHAFLYRHYPSNSNLPLSLANTSFLRQFVSGGSGGMMGGMPGGPGMPGGEGMVGGKPGGAMPGGGPTGDVDTAGAMGGMRGMAGGGGMATNWAPLGTSMGGSAGGMMGGPGGADGMPGGLPGMPGGGMPGGPGGMMTPGGPGMGGGRGGGGRLGLGAGATMGGDVDGGGGATPDGMGGGRLPGAGFPGAGMPGAGMTGQFGKPRPGRPRTEFVVIFIWREPTPSDELLPKPEEILAEGADGMGGGPGWTDAGMSR